jgi:hypothetical protein
MTQHADSAINPLPTARRSRRASTQRNHPVLVNSSPSEPEQPNAIEMEEAVATATEMPTESQPKQKGRLSFFSKVEKDGAQADPEEIAQARLARAEKNKTKFEDTSHQKANVEKRAKPAETTKQKTNRGLFKTRHFIGMAAYLFGAEFLLPLETKYIREWGLEQNFASFTLFNIPMHISTSVLASLLTLILFLLILVKLDLLPNTSRATAAARARQRQEHAKKQEAVDKPAKPIMRQGVKGEHDDLYLAYRTKQRHEKKR